MVIEVGGMKASLLSRNFPNQPRGVIARDEREAFVRAQVGEKRRELARIGERVAVEHSV